MSGSRENHGVNVSVLRGAARSLLEELLGRDADHIQWPLPADHLAGQTVLVTGAGGSIGSELCRQIDRDTGARLIMMDRDESALHAVKLSLDGHALMTTDDLALADLRDRDRIFEVMDMYRPSVVYHAAALKHLPILERAPMEAVKSNVFGTLNVLDAATHFGVESVVNISTDKAANPTSVLGWTKRIGERLTADCAASTGRRFISVRFGNVLGSRGSLLETFLAQIESGGPVTVTSPDVRRFFMTVQEAVHLVLQASVHGLDGQCHVLSMGEQILIKDVAEHLIKRSGRTVAIEYVGLRPGEKLEEELFDASEDPTPTSHPLISAVIVTPLEPSELGCLEGQRDGDPLKKVLGELAAGGT